MHIIILFNVLYIITAVGSSSGRTVMRLRSSPSVPKGGRFVMGLLTGFAAGRYLYPKGKPGIEHLTLMKQGAVIPVGADHGWIFNLDESAKSSDKFSDFVHLLEKRGTKNQITFVPLPESSRYQKKPSNLKSDSCMTRTVMVDPNPWLKIRIQTRN